MYKLPWDEGGNEHQEAYHIAWKTQDRNVWTILNNTVFMTGEKNHFRKFFANVSKPFWKRTHICVGNWQVLTQILSAASGHWLLKIYSLKDK